MKMKSFDQLYSEYENEELEVKMALQTVINDEKVVNEAAKLYQMGRAQDLVYVEQQLAKGAFFGTVKKTISTNIKRRAESRPVFDGKLRHALVRANKLPDLKCDYQAHHIVAKGDVRAKRAVEILQALGIDIDDPNNGVFLPASEKDKSKGVLKKAYVHNRVHTKPYHANVTYLVVRLFERGANKSDNELRDDMIDKLQEIAYQLQVGKFPTQTYIPGAESYAVGR